MITILKAAVAALLLSVILMFWLFAALPNKGAGQVPASGSSHWQLEADQIMTQRMATQTGMPMTPNGMLARSSDPSYLRALEQHSADIDRMLGRAPALP